jgi:hypothetical protein
MDVQIIVFCPQCIKVYVNAIFNIYVKQIATFLKQEDAVKDVKLYMDIQVISIIVVKDIFVKKIVIIILSNHKIMEGDLVV